MALTPFADRHHQVREVPPPAGLWPPVLPPRGGPDCPPRYAPPHVRAGREVTYPCSAVCRLRICSAVSPTDPLTFSSPTAPPCTAAPHGAAGGPSGTPPCTWPSPR